MHYHSASTCVADKDSYENQGPPFTSDVVDSITEAFETHLSYRSVFGLAKDGRPVYTPLHSGGNAMGDCDVDVCNGFDLNGHYSYVTTLFHPYIVGCYGPGSMPNYSQACSANPRTCDVNEDNEETTESIRLTASALVLLANLIY